jgi:DNA-binding Xre family transcriptional regulator
MISTRIWNKNDLTQSCQVADIDLHNTEATGNTPACAITTLLRVEA